MIDNAYSRIKNQTLKGKIYIDRDFYGSLFDKMTFINCAFINCDFEACVFSECVFIGCVFDNATKEQLEDGFGDVVIM